MYNLLLKCAENITDFERIILLFMIIVWLALKVSILHDDKFSRSRGNDENDFDNHTPK